MKSLSQNLKNETNRVSCVHDTASIMKPGVSVFGTGSNLKALTLCLILAVSGYANGLGLNSLDFLKPGMRWECEAFEFLGDYDHIRLMERAERLGDGCEKAEIYHNVIYDVLYGPHTPENVQLSKPLLKIEKRARFGIVKTLSIMRGHRKDNYEIVNQANRFLHRYGQGDQLSFQVHYYLVAAINREVRPANRSQQINFMAIGEHPRQQQYFYRTQIELEGGEFVVKQTRVPNNKGKTAYSENMKRMSFASFIQAYDGRVDNQDQRLVDDVKSWLDEVQELYADHFIERGDTLLSRNEPFAAASWYAQLTRRGPYIETSGSENYSAFDRGSAKLAWSYLVAAQNFAGIQPSLKVGRHPLEGVTNDVFWNIGAKPLKTNQRDFSRWLQLDRPYDPSHPDHLSRAEMATLAFCSAESVYPAATRNRKKGSFTSELEQLPSRLATEKSKIEKAIGKIIDCQ